MNSNIINSVDCNMRINCHTPPAKRGNEKQYPMKKMALSGDKLEAYLVYFKKKNAPFCLMRSLKKKKAIVIQLVQVQLRAFQLQIRAELQYQLTIKQGRFQKHRHRVKPTPAY